MKKFLSLFNSAGGVITTLIAIIGGCITGVLWLDNRFDSIEDTQEVIIDSVNVVKQDVYYLNVGQIFIDESIKKLGDSVEDLRYDVKKNTSAINLNSSIMDYERKHRDEFSAQQMEDQLEEIKEILKKNERIVLTN